MRQELLGVRVRREAMVFLISLVSHLILREERNLKCRALGPAEGGHSAWHLRFLESHTCQSHIIPIGCHLIVILNILTLYKVQLELLFCGFGNFDMHMILVRYAVYILLAFEVTDLKKNLTHCVHISIAFGR